MHGISDIPVVLGLGNLLCRDEGVGVHAVNELLKTRALNRVKLIDGGTGGPGLLDTVERASRLLVIDAVEASRSPGTVMKITGEEIPAAAGEGWSWHQVGFLEVLWLARQRGKFPLSLVLIGVQPDTLSWGTELSPAVAGAMPKVIELTLKQLDTWLN